MKYQSPDITITPGNHMPYTIHPWDGTRLADLTLQQLRRIAIAIAGLAASTRGRRKRGLRGLRGQQHLGQEVGHRELVGNFPPELRCHQLHVVLEAMDHRMP